MSAEVSVRTRPSSALWRATTRTLTRYRSHDAMMLMSALTLVSLFQWTKLSHMKKICGFVGGVLVDRPVHFDNDTEV